MAYSNHLHIVAAVVLPGVGNNIFRSLNTSIIGIRGQTLTVIVAIITPGVALLAIVSAMLLFGIVAFLLPPSRFILLIGEP